MSARGVLSAASVECAKLSAQAKVWGTLGACVLGPVVFVVAVKVQSSLPVDTLFGRWAKASGFADPLVVLGFASQWALPAIASVVGGDVFAVPKISYGTWKTLLDMRSRTRVEIFAGKALAALAFATVAVVVLGASGLVAGALLVGRQPLVGLSGTSFPPGRALVLVTYAWASVLPPTFGVLFRRDVLPRARQGAALPGWVSPWCSASSWSSRRCSISPRPCGSACSRRASAHGTGSSPSTPSTVPWSTAPESAPRISPRRSSPPTCRCAGGTSEADVGRSWQEAAILAGALGLALATPGCRDAGVTAARLEKSVGPTFANLVRLQMVTLGLTAPSVRSTARCHKFGVGAGTTGAGDWVCAIVWAGPGRMPSMTDTYDLGVTSDGCYTAATEGGESNVGGPTLIGPDGRTVTNLIYTFEGCFDTT